MLFFKKISLQISCRRLDAEVLSYSYHYQRMDAQLAPEGTRQVGPGSDKYFEIISLGLKMKRENKYFVIDTTVQTVEHSLFVVFYKVP